MTGEEALEKALDEARSGNDAIAETELALVILRAEAGEGEMPEFCEPPPCTCPPALTARGGWTSTCMAAEHGTASAPDHPIGRCADDRECMNDCGTGPCSRRCRVCQRLAGLPSEPCPACPDTKAAWA